MNITSLYPVIMAEQVELVAEYYRQHFGFEDTFTSDWYVSLRHRTAPRLELAILQIGHPTIPEGYSRASQGVVINVEVEDARAAYERLVNDAGLPAVLQLRDEEFGQRHFIVCDPAGNLVDVIENIPASSAFSDHYRE